jgi:hypothetical protein
MRLEAARIITAWLKHPTYGYTAKLALLPLDGSDVRPAAALTICDETDNASAAFRRFDGLPLPALITTVSGDPEYLDPDQPQTGDRTDAYLTLQVRYAERTSDSAAAIANGCYAITAVMASLRELHKNENIAARTRNSVQLVSCESVIEQGTYEQVEDTWLLAAVQLKYYTCNLLPLGA